MKTVLAALLVLFTTAALADDASKPATPKPVCTPPDELIVKLPFAKAVTLNNVLQDVDVGHKEWTELANDVRAQLVSQCKETKK